MPAPQRFSSCPTARHVVRLPALQMDGSASQRALSGYSRASGVQPSAITLTRPVVSLRLSTAIPLKLKACTAAPFNWVWRHLSPRRHPVAYRDVPAPLREPPCRPPRSAARSKGRLHRDVDWSVDPDAVSRGRGRSDLTHQHHRTPKAPSALDFRDIGTRFPIPPAESESGIGCQWGTGEFRPGRSKAGKGATSNDLRVAGRPR
jgi:hypothetical protein